MSSDRPIALPGLLVLSVVLALGAAGCSEIHPEPNDEGPGDIQSPTQEQDNLREDEQRQEEGGGGRR